MATATIEQRSVNMLFKDLAIQANSALRSQDIAQLLEVRYALLATKRDATWGALKDQLFQLVSKVNGVIVEIQVANLENAVKAARPDVATISAAYRELEKLSDTGFAEHLDYIHAALSAGKLALMALNECEVQNKVKLVRQKLAAADELIGLSIAPADKLAMARPHLDLAIETARALRDRWYLQEAATRLIERGQFTEQNFADLGDRILEVYDKVIELEAAIEAAHARKAAKNLRHAVNRTARRGK